MKAPQAKKWFKSRHTLLLTFFLLHNSFAAITQKEYDDLIRSTKGNLTAQQLAPAIDQLRDWHTTDPHDFHIIFDLMVLLDKAGDYSAACELIEQFDISKAPAYAISATAHAMLKAGQFQKAETTYQLLLTKTPNDSAAQIGLVYAWMGQRRTQEALDYVQHMLSAETESNPANRTKQLPILIAQAELHEQRQDWLQAASSYQKALQLNPEFRYAKRGLVFALSHAGLIYLANYYVEQDPSVFSRDELYQFVHDDSALTIRYGEAQLNADNARSRVNSIDIALAENAVLTQRFGESDKAKFDRITALDDRGYMQEVVQIYQSLLDAKTAIPAYVKSAVADAYLYLEQPELARDLYLDIINNWNSTDQSSLLNNQIQLLYAYSDTGQYQAAEALAKQLVEHQIQQIDRSKNADRNISPDYLRVLEVNANLQKNLDHLNTAEQQISNLRKQAPFNNDIRSAWASLLLAREQPRTALDEFTLMLIDQPTSMDAALGRGEVLLSLNELAQAQAVLPALLDNYPDNKSVQNYAQRLSNYDQALYRLETTLGHGATKSGADSVTTATIYSAPFSLPSDQDSAQADGLSSNSNWSAKHLRLFTQLEQTKGETNNNISESRNRLAVGMDYRSSNLSAELEATHTLNDASKNGAAVNLSWTISDNWHTRVSVDTNMINIPAVAMLEGITAQESKFQIDWTKNESRKAGIDLSSTHFSDDNVRNAIFTWWMERWFSEPLYKIDSVLGLSSSTNSLPNRDYFNPIEDKELNVDVKGEWLTWHRYQRAFRQRFDLTLGHYWQRDFASGATAGLRYEHEWDFENDLALTYGIGRNFHPYDGGREYRNYVYLNLSGRIK